MNELVLSYCSADSGVVEGVPMENTIGYPYDFLEDQDRKPYGSKSTIFESPCQLGLQVLAYITRINFLSIL